MKRPEHLQNMKHTPGNNREDSSAQSTSGGTGGNDCIHMWSIEPPNGPTSLGTCTDCGDTKEFRNSVEMSYWDNKRKHVPENLPPKKTRAVGRAAAKPSGKT